MVRFMTAPIEKTESHFLLGDDNAGIIEPHCASVVAASSANTLSAAITVFADISSRFGANDPIEMQVVPGDSLDLKSGTIAFVHANIKSEPVTAASISIDISMGELF